MNEERINAITDLVKKVIEINVLKGTKIAVDVKEDSLSIYDIENGCKSIIAGETLSQLYFCGVLGTYFNETLNNIYKALERY